MLLGTKRLVLATKNPGKVREIKLILEGLGIQFLPLNEISDPPDIEEDEYTYRDNALKKAAIISLHTGLPTLGEDSGLEVDALGGRPGIFSSRYAGINASDEDNIKKLLDEMKDIPFEKRTARYCSAVALATPGDERLVEEAEVNGIILFEKRGTGGFGYDPVFFVQEYDKTMAEIGIELKNRISHRGRALKKLKREIIRLFKGSIF